MIRVLYVDDDSAMAQIVEAVLPKEEFTLTVSNSGNGGVSDAMRLKPDFILLDQILPDIPGNKVLELLKKDLETKDIPVVFLSAYSSDKLIELALKKGAIEYLQNQNFDLKGLGLKIK